MDNSMNTEFLSISENESFARVVVAAFASQLNPTAAEIAEIKTAVSEAVTNAIIHGYENDIGTVRIEGNIHNNRIEISVIDYGWGIADIEEAKKPLFTGKPELERSGMGFSIMESFMDSIEVISSPGEGTTVKMTKNIEEQA